MTNASDLKFSSVVAYLSDKIRNQDLDVGDQTPSERELAAHCGVSYMTARRAVTKMVEENILERQPSSGTFVRAGARERLATTLNLICVTYDSPSSRVFIKEGGNQARLRGWRANILRFPRGDDYLAIKAILGDGLSLVLADMAYMEGPIPEAMTRAKGRAALVGGILDAPQVPGIRSQAGKAVHMAVDYLRKRGHRRIAFALENLEWPVDKVRVQAWRECFPTEAQAAALKNHLICVGTPVEECPARYAYQAVKKYLASGHVPTALICSVAEMAFGAISAFREAGLLVPEQVSIVTLQDSSLFDFSSPPVMCVDEDVTRQVQLAMQTIDKIVSGKEMSPGDWVKWVSPLLVERQSVTPCHNRAEWQK